jgi:hypothetical protein
MLSRTIWLGGLAVATYLACGSLPARAGDPDVDGMDHSKLNHGVLGPTVQRDVQSAQAPKPTAQAPKASAQAPTTIVWVNPGATSQAATPAGQTDSSDPNVTGMDHSKLDHGVLGVARR